MTFARTLGLAGLLRAILPAGGVAALLLALALASASPSRIEARFRTDQQQAEARDTGRLSVLRPADPAPVARRAERAGERRATPHYPLAFAPRPGAAPVPVLAARLQAVARRAPPETAPGRYFRARAPPAAA